jgi:uncharacterized protein YhaN
MSGKDTCDIENIRFTREDLQNIAIACRYLDDMRKEFKEDMAEIRNSLKDINDNCRGCRSELEEKITANSEARKKQEAVASWWENAYARAGILGSLCLGVAGFGIQVWRWFTGS